MFNFGTITFNRDFEKCINNLNIYFNEYYTAMDFYTKVLENINYKYKVTITKYNNSIPYLKKTKKETKYYNKINDELSKNFKICIKIWFKNDRFSAKELASKIKDYSYNNKFYFLYKRYINNIRCLRIAVFNGLTDELDKMILKDIKTEEMF